MPSDTPAPTPPPPAPPARAGHSSGRRPHRLLRVMAWLLVLGLATQAGLAGPAWFLQPQLFEIHGLIGSGVLVLAALVALIAVLGRQSGAICLTAVVVFALTFAQIGLGYVGRRGGVTLASALHVPIGVLLLGLAVGVAMAISLGVRRAVAPTTTDAPPSTD